MAVCIGKLRWRVSGTDGRVSGVMSTGEKCHVRRAGAGIFSLAVAARANTKQQAMMNSFLVKNYQKLFKNC